MTEHERWMTLALAEAERAGALGEVPVGAVIVKDGAVVARSHNLTETRRDPTGHAEIVAIRAACEALGDKWLIGCTLYVTLEPCPMCAGAVVLARLDRIVYGAIDPKAGACGSLMDIPRDPRLNHRPALVGGVLAEPAGALLAAFFRARRKPRRPEPPVG